MDASGQIQGSIHGRYDIMRLTSPGFGVQFKTAISMVVFSYLKISVKQILKADGTE